MTSDPSARRNENVPWEQFDARSYAEHNYETLAGEDAEILSVIRDYLIAHPPPPHSRCLDIGAGTNLYPALSMLPWADSIDLIEFSSANCRWMNDALATLPGQWRAFWEVLAVAQPYQGLAEPWSLLAQRASVQQGSIFDLPRGAWDIGSMFFVAESITEDPAEFKKAVRQFVQAVRPGGVLLAAFMEGSAGYDVGGIKFPAVAVGVPDVEAAFNSHTHSLEVRRLPIRKRIREGYTGMIVLTGER